MGRFMTIIKWKPEQGQELARRVRSITGRTAPQELLDAVAKMKPVTQAYSPNNGLLVMIYDVDDKDYVDATLAAIYVSDTCKMKTYPVLGEADTLKLGQMTQKIFPDRT